MATNFPTSVDVLTNPVSNDSLNSPSHSAQHANANDAIEAIEGYLLTGAGASGLVKMIPTSAVGGTIDAAGTVTIGSAVSTVSLNGCFTSAYSHYRVIFAPLASSTTGTTTYIRFRTGSTDNSNANYAWAGNQVTYAGTGSTGFGTAQTLGFICFGSYTTGNAWGSCVLDIFNPQLTQFTTWEAQGTGVNTGGVVTKTTFGGYFANNTSFDGITFLPTAGTLTGGTISVYGYK
jgi:hypothetical protein